MPGVGKHRQFAAARADHLAVHEDDVAEVDVGLPPVEGFLPHLGQADHRLQLGAVAVLQGGEAELAGVAGEHHPAGDADDVAGLGVGGQVGIGGANLGEGVGARHLHRVGLAALGEQPLALGLTNPELLGEVGLTDVAAGAAPDLMSPTKRLRWSRVDQVRSRRASLSHEPRSDGTACGLSHVVRVAVRLAAAALTGCQGGRGVRTRDFAPTFDTARGDVDRCVVVGVPNEAAPATLEYCL